MIIPDRYASARVKKDKAGPTTGLVWILIRNLTATVEGHLAFFVFDQVEGPVGAFVCPQNGGK